MGVYKHKEGHNELSCFVLEGGVSHYKFQWLKNGLPIEPNDNNSLVEYVEDMTKPIGLMLKLGKIQVSTIFREKNIFFWGRRCIYSHVMLERSHQRNTIKLYPKTGRSQLYMSCRRQTGDND